MKPERLTSAAAWEIRVFSLRRWVGAAAWPMRSSGTKAAPSRRLASMPASRTASRDDDGIRPIRQALAGERSEKLVLAVAGDARDAEDLAALAVG